ncbi:PREDICTED: protein AE7-like 1 [Brassica oleracea var. oleracea]|uniref:protein AE7-like 1 n=1 Tax=Brassica oleracea var. oleracea TaxID=109376 RepID=UPI0006A6C8C2|nr:PREDICTED: protein AE7-like 1 [Brassica oleracea var. oleracea]
MCIVCDTDNGWRLVNEYEYESKCKGMRNTTKYVRDIRDPEHPYSLEQLSALSEDSITLNDKLNRVLITFTPTIQHCSMSTIIGLRLRAKLKECLPLHYKVDTKVSPGSHAVEHSGHMGNYPNQIKSMKHLQ